MGSTGARRTNGGTAVKKQPPGKERTADLDFNEYMIQNYGITADDLMDDEYERARQEYKNSQSLSNSAILKVAQQYVQNHLNVGEQFAEAEKAELVSDIDDNGYANVKIDYKTRVRIAVGYNAELNQLEYEDDTEYHTDTFRMKVR